MANEEQNPLFPLIPDEITVHLGSPASSAQNVTVSFRDYIKNVASSELYPTWPENALRANIYAQISFALNRIYTEYYRSRGFNYDITSDTSVDQSFVNNRDIFENVAYIVDDIFNSYLRREGAVEPLFAQYCNGTTTTCNGLSQWGSVALAEQGLSPIEILRRYYGDSVEIVTNVPVAGISESVPDVQLRIGSAGNNVALLQTRLNRISVNYPNIPKISNVDGIYGPETESAVIEFQRTFDLAADGITGRATWYSILRVYNAVKRINELNSEQLQYSEIPIIYPVDLRLGDTGFPVRYVQYYLSYVAAYNDAVPEIAIDGIFGAATEEAVKAFQLASDLPVTGIIERNTFTALYNDYISIINSFPENMFENSAVPFGGITLIEGSGGEQVLLLQRYLNTISTVYPQLGTLTEDGIFGPSTEAAVIAFQNLASEPANGVVGALTWRAIGEYYDNILAGRYRQNGQWAE